MNIFEEASNDKNKTTIIVFFFAICICVEEQWKLNAMLVNNTIANNGIRFENWENSNSPEIALISITKGNDTTNAFIALIGDAPRIRNQCSTIQCLCKDKSTYYMFDEYVTINFVENFAYNIYIYLDNCGNERENQKY